MASPDSPTCSAGRRTAGAFLQHVPEPCAPPLCLAHRHSQCSAHQAPLHTQTGPSLPSRPLPAVHPQPDTHTQPVAQRPPNFPMLAPHSMPPSVPESCRRGKGSDQSQHSWVPAPCPVDACTHTHTHESHANSSSRPLPPAALAPARNGQLAICLSAPSVCPLEKTQSYLHAVCGQVPAPSGTHRLGFLPFSPFGERTFRTASLAHRSWSPKPGQSFPARLWPGPDTALMDEPH